MMSTRVPVVPVNDLHSSVEAPATNYVPSKIQRSARVIVPTIPVYRLHAAPDEQPAFYVTKQQARMMRFEGLATSIRRGKALRLNTVSERGANLRDESCKINAATMHAAATGSIRALIAVAGWLGVIPTGCGANPAPAEA